MTLEAAQWRNGPLAPHIIRTVTLVLLTVKLHTWLYLADPDAQK